MSFYSVNPQTPEALQLFFEGSQALGAAERNGLCLDLDYCEKTGKMLDRKMRRIRSQLDETELFKLWRRAYPTDTNFNSDPQLGQVLYKHMGLEAKKTTEKGNPSVDSEALLALDLPEVPQLLEYRRLDKMLNTYIASIMREQVDGMIHPFFNLNRVITFRSSSDSPNFQNFPKRDPDAYKIIRSAIRARPDHRLLAIDYSGVEVKVAACYHHDPKMFDYLLSKDSDMHRDVACDAFFLKADLWDKWAHTPEGKRLGNIRHTAKNKFTFPQFYGDYFGSCAPAMWADVDKDTHVLPDGTRLKDHLAKHKIKNLKDFTDHIKKVEDIFWNKRFKKYTQWKKDWYAEYIKKGYFDSLTGFRYQGHIEKNQVINYAVQGSAFHCLLKAFTLAWKQAVAKKWRSKLVAQIHDEMILDVHKDEFDYVLEDCVRIMTKLVPEEYRWICVPLEVEAEATPIGGSWYEVDDIEL